MGNEVSMLLGNRFKVRVTTGDQKGAGTDANVYMVVYDDQGSKSEVLKLDKALHNDLERGRKDEYTGPKVSEEFGSITEIEIWRDDFGAFAPWFCDLIEIMDHKSGENLVFPVQRWIKKEVHYKIPMEHTCLPQDEKYPEMRSQELQQMKEMYQYEEKLPGLPMLVKTLPEDEQFSDSFKLDVLKLKYEILIKSKLERFRVKRNWSKLEDIGELFTSKLFPKPKGLKFYKDDLWFSAQRLAGANPISIALCTEIPEKFQVNDDLVGEFLEGNTLAEAIEKKKLFIVDHKIVDGLPVSNEGSELPAPMALFYMDKEAQLRPIAIQLKQEAGPENPVFVPSDPEKLWLVAKMWFNLADAMVQMTITHSGRTHIMMEGICLSTRRNLALNHPLYRLMAPHFHNLLAINVRGFNVLISPEGYVQRTMQIGLDGYTKLIHRGHEEFRLNVDGCLLEDLKARGVDSPDVLPVYPYRCDGLLIYTAIETYVSSILMHYYDTPEKLQNDHELKAWGKELATPTPEGLGIKGVPNDGDFQNVDDLIMVITSVIFTCSAQHALSFLQYDHLAFPVSYPTMLFGKLPKDKEHEPTDQELLDMLPDMETTLENLLLTKVASVELTEKLGYWPTQFQYDKMAVQAEETFRSELKEIPEQMAEKNKARSEVLKFDILDPEKIPNSISI